MRKLKPINIESQINHSFWRNVSTKVSGGIVDQAWTKIYGRTTGRIRIQIDDQTANQIKDRVMVKLT